MSLAILFHFWCTQHVSDINISITRSFRLCCWITTSLKHNWSCASACNTDITQTQPHQISNTQRTENKTTDVVIQQHSRKLLMMDILMSETCWAHKKWKKKWQVTSSWSFILQLCTTLITFPLQQWLHERASMLHYTYTACRVQYTVHGHRPA